MNPVHDEFLKVLTDYQGIIHKVNLIYFKTDMDKQDNFQEVVFQLWRSFPSLKNKNKPASWIYSVAINTSISKIRKDCNLTFQESLPDFSMVEQPEFNEDANYQQLLAALSRLNEIDKSIMLLYLEEFSYEQIADIVGISPSHVGVKIHRLKTQLQKQFNR
ncbi:RNA polymerase sigma factor [Sunxiuqinia elliptica]|uniref:RNA polymerase sigma-70 factor, ECF subfamily n=1 Tax=Sunxiuqinia elliptica TaxID=655355 RepID=A0A1I2FTL4_9BACT|nr:sigma-70 family RNA polymerase sigma factor [Sunxiuqinia elliptica]SFF08754.1 RNA polymerase sigma-70 factor, ECF subfamily [Sunxiuqinia elliptica]